MFARAGGLLLLLLAGCGDPTAQFDAPPPAPPAAQVTAEATEPPFTWVFVPDIQFYSEQYPWIWQAQVAWIAAMRDSLNIRFVSQGGDLVDNVGVPAEWQVASDGMAVLDSVVPVGIAAGNHDIEDHWGSTAGSWATYQQWFPLARYSGLPYWGGAYSSASRASSYQLLTVGSEAFLVLHLEFQCPDDCLAWATGVVDAHPDRRVLLVTHSYLNKFAQRMTTSANMRAAGNQGEAIWQKLVRRSPNIRLVHSAHICGEARLVSTNDAGERVDEILADYQCLSNGGDGWLRYYTFDAAAGEIRAYTYSPTLDAFDTDSASQFALPYAPFSPSAPPPPPPPPPSADRAMMAISCGPLKVNGKSDCVFDATGSTGAPITWIKCPTCVETMPLWSDEVAATPVYRTRIWSLVAGMDTIRGRWVAPDSGLVEILP